MTAATERRRPRAAWRGAAVVFGIALGLTLVMAAPVLLEPGTRLFGEEIAGRHHDPFTVIKQYENPGGLGLYTQPATDWSGALAARLLGDGVRAYNFMALATFPLAALFAFLYARRLTGSAAGAGIAALAYAFLPFHWSHAAYHPHGAQTQWLPLYLLALWLCGERFTATRAGLLALAATLVALSSFYYGLIAAVLTPVALLGQWVLPPAQDRPRRRRALAATTVFLAALAALGLGYVARFAPTVLSSPSALGFPAEDVTRYTARWWSYFMPPVGHPLGGEALAQFWSRQDLGGLVERQLTLGFGLMALAAVAVVSWLGGSRRDHTRTVPMLALLAAAAFAASMPPVWRLGPLTIPGLSGLLHQIAPMFRAHARFALAVGLAVAVLAGIGFDRLRRGSPLARAAAAILLTLTVVELLPFPPWRWRDVLPTSAHRWLARQPEPMKIMDCVDARDPAQASADRFFDKALFRLPPLTDCGDPQTVDGLVATGFTHLVVRRESTYGRWLSDRPTPAGLEPVGDFADATVFRLEGPGPRLRARYAAGFFEREYSGLGGYRWMAGRGRLELFQALPESLEAALELRLHAFPGAREVDAVLDGRTIARLSIGEGPAPHRLDLGELAPGRHQLELLPLAPPAVPNEHLANGDLRPLTIALWDWRWFPGPS